MRYLLLTALLGVLCPYESFSSALSYPQFSLGYAQSREFSFSTELFSYPSTISYKAGSNTVITPTITTAGGVFVAKRITPGPGMISLDEQSGQINLRNSDPGRYSITYTVNGQTQTISIVIS
jgi:hypothetical protein